MNRGERLKVLEEVQKLLGVEDSQLGQLPQLIRALVQAVTREPVLVTFAFDPLSGQLRQVGASPIPALPEAYLRVAQTTMTLAQRFQAMATEVMNVGGVQKGMGEGQGSRRDDELRDGSVGRGDGSDETGDGRA